MQNFRDAATGQYWALDDDVVVTAGGDGLTFYNAMGELLVNVPKTLVAVSEIPEPGQEPAPPAEPRRIFSVREFRQRFTMDEQMAIRAASFTDMAVGLTYDEFLSAQFIDVTDPAVAAGIDLYISKGLLLPSRRGELLAMANDQETLA